MEKEPHPADTNGLEKIRLIATTAHHGQFRRDGVTPYIKHPEAVVTRVDAEDINAQMVAWLHDVLEDTELTANQLRSMLVPDAVVTAVELMTHPDGEPYEIYLTRIKANPLATKVKIADMLTNLADTPTEQQIRKYAHGLLFLLN
jgi:(p)ppGpp synthase/HD superfamily hydrolase